jgi:hypothetical protein
MSHRTGGGDGILAMSVDNIGFLLDRLGQDCHPLQFLRELTQNSIEAIEHQGEPGEIVWDVDWNTYDLEGVQKLCLIDTGVGMTGEDMVRYINQLSSSVSTQSIYGNYGVGAKVAAAPRNHSGLLYLSWTDGRGAMIHLFRDSETGQYGLKQFERADGSYGHHLEIEDTVKPEMVGDHGTVVILYGNDEDENTMQPPAGAASPSRWVSKYINTRYYRFPAGVVVKAREGWEYDRSDTDRNLLRTLVGQEAYLAKHAASSGAVELDGATAHWWILKDEPALTNNSGFVESAGHMAALRNNELYELATARAGMSRLQNFGVTFGYRFVVIYVEPTAAANRIVTTNTARTALLVNNEPLPWADWAHEFREKLPKEIKELVREKAGSSATTDHSASIRERLKDILGLYKVTRYRPMTHGTVMADDQQLARGGAPASTGSASQTGSGSGRTGSPGGRTGNVYSFFEKKDGTPAKPVKPDPFPDTRWVSVKDGTREYGDIEDRAAKYLADQNILLINSDFRVFADVVTFLVSEVGDEPGVHELATDAVRTWFEQALTETVMGIQALRNSKEWSLQDIGKAMSEEALTTAVMQRYHVRVAAKRELGAKLGSLKKKAG